MKESKKVRKKERKHALGQESDQENGLEKKKIKKYQSILLSITLIVSVICRFDQIEYI